ncbi:MAG TPA: TonB family protein [Chthoniobacterales bacterium]
MALLALNLPDVALSKSDGKDTTVVSSAGAQADLLFHPSPKYPVSELYKYREGEGGYLIRFNRETGVAQEVTVIKSAGSASLDETVTATLRRWRAKPHTINKVYVPVSFSIAGEQEQRTLRQAEGDVLESPYPKIPLAVRWEHPGGEGTFRLQIDRKTGLVTSVQTLRTMGDNRLDAAALEALRKWRFKPQTLSQMAVSIKF